ncbi:MAG: hypothetical protein ABJB11_06930 [Ferruginibacter sp.]
MYSTETLYGGIALVLIFFLALFLIPTIFYLLTLHRTLMVISEGNRRMEPAQVWLSLIPVFNFVWMFIVVNRLAESIAAECTLLNIPLAETNPTQGIGNTKNILRLCTMIPLVGILAGFGYLVCWILHWVKVHEYKNMILANKDNMLLDAEKGIFHH